MTEQKKAFIADALDAVADEFIAEAVEYQKTHKKEIKLTAN